MFYTKHFCKALNKLFILKQYNFGILSSIQQCSKSTSNTKNITRVNFTLKDLIQHISTGREFYLKQLANIFHTIDFTKLTSDEALLLLKCCGADVPDSSCENRHNICRNVFKGLEKANNLNINIYNCYIKICNENNVYIHYNDFLSTLKCQPDQETYKLLIENVCQLGKATDAFVILEIMKNQNHPIDIEVFNNLAMANSIQGGLKLSEVILNVMKSTQIEPNNKTKISILKGLIKRGDLKDFTIVSEIYNFEFTVDDFLIILKELGLMGNEDWLSLIQNNFKHILITRDLEMRIEKVCIHLIHMNLPISAMKIYEQFIKSTPGKLYGYKLLKEMLHCKVDTKIIVPMVQKLEENGLSEYLLEALTQVTLKLLYVEEAWVLLNALNIKRPHYFWPLFVHYGKIDKENGVFHVLNKMEQYNIRADEETLENYLYPFCDFSNLKLLVQKMQNLGYNLREVLSPLLVNVLKTNNLKEAFNLCNMYEINITGKAVPTLLGKCWAETKELSVVINILKKYCESNKNRTDAVGLFLNRCLKKCKSENDYQDFVKLVQMLKEHKLTISLQSAGDLQNLLQSCQTNLGNTLFSTINTIVDFNQQFNEDIQLPHPKNMDIDSLECHLIELEAKNMETRGVLRKLMQQHAQKGNIQRIKEIQTKLTELGYETSLGMKSLIMHNFTLGGHIEEAFQLYSEITATSNFQLDDFKIIDLITLLLKNNRFDEGLHILETSFSNRKSYRNTKAIERNCWELLTACKNADQIRKMFNLLLENKLCIPTNVILGPIIRCHLNSSNVKKVTEAYIECANKYTCTPLQLEVLRFTLTNGDSTSLQAVLQATEQVHGVGPTSVGLIAALAENNQKKKLRNILENLTVPIKKLLEKRCDRWVKEGKIEPLLCLAEALDGLSEFIISSNYIHTCVVDVYRSKNDYLGALNFYNNLPENTYRTPSLKNKINDIKNINVIIN